MRGTTGIRRAFYAFALLSLCAIMVFGIAGCGDLDPFDDSSDDDTQLPISTSSMQQWESDAIATDITSALGDAFNNMTVSSAGVGEKSANVMVNVSTSYTLNCTAGGHITVNGSGSGSFNDSGTGMVSVSATETISDWACVSGKIINGDPYVSAVGTFSFINGQPATQQTVSVTGGFKWGLTALESCQIYLTFNFPTATSGTSSVSGTVCGNTVYQTF